MSPRRSRRRFIGTRARTSTASSLEGRSGALLGEDVVEAGSGDLVFKPRNQWHTFWNAATRRAGSSSSSHPPASRSTSRSWWRWVAVARRRRRRLRRSPTATGRGAGRLDPAADRALRAPERESRSREAGHARGSCGHDFAAVCRYGSRTRQIGSPCARWGSVPARRVVTHRVTHRVRPGLVGCGSARHLRSAGRCSSTATSPCTMTPRTSPPEWRRTPGSPGLLPSTHVAALGTWRSGPRRPAPSALAAASIDASDRDNRIDDVSRSSGAQRRVRSARALSFMERSLTGGADPHPRATRGVPSHDRAVGHT